MKKLDELNSALDYFNNDNEKNQQNEKFLDYKQSIIKEDRSIIERVDKIYVTKDGKQLLREQY